jgi:hypothetical protein
VQEDWDTETLCIHFLGKCADAIQVVCVDP